MKVQKLIITGISLILIFAGNIQAQSGVKPMKEQYRPQVHFSPQKGWMNDPNGMVYNKGVYHLFFQHYPDKPVWGPMHWGHATSKDLIYWQEQPIALYPDSLGYIFSGSAVVDVHNTTGFGKNGQSPLVAIFTHHLPDAPPGNITFQNQSLAYSVDNGKTWTKYQHNPVLKNPGIIDFRDPKVMWYESQKKWIMTLATKDRITFYSSPDLKNWKKESEFGEKIGAHGGVWECPDLFSLDDSGKKVWVLLVNLNPGGPNKGSATQYFTGSFDGEKFTPYSTETKWLDYGPDEYAGITWSNTGDRKIFIGWMSNWEYANIVPTTAWRSAATIARELKIKHAGDQLLVASEPVAELSVIQDAPVVLNNVAAAGKMDIGKKIGGIKFPCRLNLQSVATKDFSLVLSNGLGEELAIGYDKTQNQYFIDRSKSGKIDFYNGFGARHIAPRFSNQPAINLTLVIDVSSVELFADDGLTVMTEIFFPGQPYNQIHLQSADGVKIKKVEYRKLKTIFP